MHKLINVLSDWPRLLQALVADEVFWGLRSVSTSIALKGRA